MPGVANAAGVRVSDGYRNIGVCPAPGTRISGRSRRRGGVRALAFYFPDVKPSMGRINTGVRRKPKFQVVGIVRTKPMIVAIAARKALHYRAAPIYNFEIIVISLGFIRDVSRHLAAGAIIPSACATYVIAIVANRIEITVVVLAGVVVGIIAVLIPLILARTQGSACSSPAGIIESER